MGRSFVLFAAFAGAAADATLRGTNLMAADMQPSVVSHLLSEVEHSWEQSALSALMGQESEAKALMVMQKSCQKVTKSIIDGSEGDKDRVMEYMSEVCAASKGESSMICGDFSAQIDAAMTHDAYHNREELNLVGLCGSFYQSTVVARAKKTQKVLEASAAEKKKEEEAKLAAAEAKKHEAKAAERHSEIVNAEKEVQEGEAAVEEADAKTAAIEKEGQTVKALVGEAQQDMHAAEAKELAVAEAQAKKAADEAAEKQAQVAARKASEATAAAAALKKQVAAKKQKKVAVAAASPTAKATEVKSTPAVKAPEAKEPTKAAVDAKPAAEHKPAAEKKAVAALATRVGHCPACGSLVCPHGFTAQETEGHCCPYCVNPAISTEVVKDPAYYAEKAAPVYKKYR